MKKWIVLLTLLLLACETETLAKPGESFVTYVETEGLGNIAVQVTLPDEPRYVEGAPVVVPISTFFTDPNGFDQEITALTSEGVIHVSYLWPGKSTRDGVASEGEFDYGGEDSIRALADVIAFASGSGVNHEGNTLDEMIGMDVQFENTGLYAFSHPGIAMVNVMALHGESLPNVSYLVGRENPTDDIFSSVELGYWEEKTRNENPLYSYDLYDEDQIEIDYSSAAYDFDLDRAYFDLNGNGQMDGEDHILGSRIPQMFGKRCYSIEMTRALEENGLAPWPEDLAKVEEVEAWWPFRTSVHNFDRLPVDLNVMLVFSSTQHVQAAYDAPSIHQAWDGFKSAGLWVRLNPDASYIEEYSQFPVDTYQEHDANTEPENWARGSEWGYEPFRGAAQVAGFAAVLEMADRTQFDEWSEDLTVVFSGFYKIGDR